MNLPAMWMITHYIMQIIPLKRYFPSLQESSEKLFKWFSDNQMQGNSGKCHMILRINELVKIQIGESLIESTKVPLLKKLLGAKIDSKFSFNKHIKGVCIKEIIKGATKL